eukprot:XP_789620.2 PREDICTED: protein TBATA isoform X2 [Strongylocentrotus purpuratus]
MSIPVYRPSKGDGLVVRHTMGHVPENNARSTHHAVSKLDFAGRRPHTQASARFGQLSQSSFFARHNPQSKRVRHIKGLLDVPICAVHDEGYFTNPRLRRRPATAEARGMYTFRIPKPTKEVYNLNPTINASQYPINTLTGLSMFPQGFREKTHAPMFGLIPVTDKWRDELRDITEQAGLGLPNEIKQAQAEQPKRTSVYSADTGRLIPPPSRAMTRGASRQKHHEHDLMYHIAVDGSNESLVLEMLCQILQTDSLTAVQSWLVSAGDREKSLVLDMIRSAMNSEADYFQRNIAEAPPPPRPSTNLPANMNVTNGYGDVDIPSPPPFAGRDVRYQAVAEAAAGLKTPKKAENQEKTIFDAEDHPALRQRSHKPDVFKVEHNSSPRPATKNGMHPAKLPPLSPPKHDGGQQDIQNGVSWKPDEAVV